MNPERPSDLELVHATLKERDAFAALIERYEAPLSRYIRRLGCSDPETITDILQEAFIKAYVNLNDFDTTLSFSAWLYRIVHNETMNFFRRQKNRPQSVENENDLTIFERIADDLNIEKESQQKFEKDAVAHAVAKLEQKYRDVIILNFFEDKSYDEISDILRIPLGTVGTYLHRAKNSLRIILNKKDTLGV